MTTWSSLMADGTHLKIADGLEQEYTSEAPSEQWFSTITSAVNTRCRPYGEMVLTSR